MDVVMCCSDLPLVVKDLSAQLLKVLLAYNLQLSTLSRKHPHVKSNLTEGHLPFPKWNLHPRLIDEECNVSDPL